MGNPSRTAYSKTFPSSGFAQAEKREDNSVVGSVKPEPVPLTDPLASVNGANSMVTFELDTLYGLTLSEQNPDAVTTAYGPLADLVAIARDA